MQNSDDPPYLPVGMEVSAKFKGAFCEAKIKRILRNLRMKVTVKEPYLRQALINDDQLKHCPALEVGGAIEFFDDEGQTHRGIVNFIKDYSSYHVVFNDGDEKTLKRSQICRKSPKHFAVNLDALPLYNPEQFGTPVLKERDAKDKKRKVATTAYQGKRRKQETVAVEKNDKEEEEDNSAEGSSKSGKDTNRLSNVRQTKANTSSPNYLPEDRKRGRRTTINSKSSVPYSPEEKIRRPLMASIDYMAGDVYSVFEKDNLEGKWFPAVVVALNVFQTATKSKQLGCDEIPVRSFQNGRYYAVHHKSVTHLDQKERAKAPSSIKLGVEKAFAYLDKNILPPGWEKSDIFDIDFKMDKESTTSDESKVIKSESEDDDNADDDDVSDDDESSPSKDSNEEEKKNFFVAQLYKFQEERGTPMNSAPAIGKQELDLHMFHQIVNESGGFKRITTNNQWDKVLEKMKLEDDPEATPGNLKDAYEKYLFHFEAFHKRLGWAIGNFSSTSSRSRERRPTQLASEASTPKTSDKRTKKNETGKEGKGSRKSKSRSAKKKKRTKHVRKIKRPRWKQRKAKRNIVNIKYKIPGYFQFVPFVKMYVGQPVLVQYEGDWYDAQTIKISQPAIEQVVQRFQTLQGEKNGLKKIMKILETSRRTNQIFVHYNDWDSSFDEWIYLDDIQIKAADLYSGCHIMKKICEDLDVSMLVWERILKFYGVHKLFHYLQNRESNPKFSLDEDEPIRLTWLPDKVEKYTRKYAHAGGHTKYPYRRRRTFRLSRWRRKFLTSQMNKWRSFKFMKVKKSSCRVKKPPRGRNKRAKTARSSSAFGEGKQGSSALDGTDAAPRTISREREMELKAKVMARAVSILEPVYDLKFVEMDDGNIIHIPLPTKPQVSSGRCPVKPMRERKRVQALDVYNFISETPRVKIIIDRLIELDWDCDAKELDAIMAAVPREKPTFRYKRIGRRIYKMSVPKVEPPSVDSYNELRFTPISKCKNHAETSVVYEDRPLKQEEPPSPESVKSEVSEKPTNKFFSKSFSNLYYVRLSAMITAKLAAENKCPEPTPLSPLGEYLRKLRLVRAFRLSSCSIKQRIRTRLLRGEKIKIELYYKSKKCRRGRLNVSILKIVGWERYNKLSKIKKRKMRAKSKRLTTSASVSKPSYHHDLIKPIPSMCIPPASVYLSKDSGTSNKLTASLSGASAILGNNQFGASSAGFQPVVSTPVAFQQGPNSGVDFSQLNHPAALNAALNFGQAVNTVVGFNHAVNTGLGFHPVNNAGAGFNQVVTLSFNSQQNAQPLSQSQHQFQHQPKAQTPVQVPVKTPLQVPAQAPVQVPVKNQTQAPVSAQVQPPVQASVKSRGKSPVKAPVKAALHTSVQASSQSQAQNSVQAQAKAPTPMQSQIPSQPQSHPQLVSQQKSFQTKAQSQLQSQLLRTPQPQTHQQTHSLHQAQILSQLLPHSSSLPQPQSDSQSVSQFQLEESPVVPTMNGRPLITTKAAVKVVSTPAILARSRSKGVPGSPNQSISIDSATLTHPISSSSASSSAATLSSKPLSASIYLPTPISKAAPISHIPLAASVAKMTPLPAPIPSPVPFIAPIHAPIPLSAPPHSPLPFPAPIPKAMPLPAPIPTTIPTPIATPTTSASLPMRPGLSLAATSAKNVSTPANMPSSNSSFSAVPSFAANTDEITPRVTVPVPSTPSSVSAKIKASSASKTSANVDNTKKPSPETGNLSTPKPQEPRPSRTPSSTPASKVDASRKASPSSLKRKASSQELSAPAPKQSKSKEKAAAVVCEIDEQKTCLFSLSAAKQKIVVLEKMKKEESTNDYDLLGISVDVEELTDVPDFSDEKIEELFARLETLKDLYDCEKKNLLVSEKEYKERVDALVRESFKLPM